MCRLTTRKASALATPCGLRGSRLRKSTSCSKSGLRTLRNSQLLWQLNQKETAMLIGKILYKGDNGTQEFWESVDHELLLLRLHRETCWTVHRNCMFVCAADSAEEAAAMLGSNVRLTTDHVWKRDGKGDFTLSTVDNPKPFALTPKPPLPFKRPRGGRLPAEPVFT